MMNKTIKAMVVALTLVAGNAVYAMASSMQLQQQVTLRDLSVTTNEIQPLDVELGYYEYRYTGDYYGSVKFSLSKATPYHMDLMWWRGVFSLTKITVNGKEIWNSGKGKFQTVNTIQINRSGDKFVANISK